MLLFKVFLKKISIIIASLLSLFLFLVLIIIILLTSYPKHGIAVIDKLFIHSYELSFQDIQLKSIFSNPYIKASGIEITNDAQIIEIQDFELSFKLLDFVLEERFILNKLHINGYQLTKNNTNTSETRNNTNANILNGNDLLINTNALKLSASSYYLRSNLNKSSIVLVDGVINKVPFKDLNLLIEANGDIFYSGSHDLDASNLDDLGIIKMSSFKVAAINAYIESRGYVSTNKPSKNTSTYKIKLSNTNLTFNSGYSVSNINSLLYADFQNNLFGRFTSSLPLQDVIQDISGNVTYQKNIGLELFSDFSFNMSKILKENNYFSLSGKESFQTKLKITNDQTISLSLKTDLQNTNVYSSINEISKPVGEPLLTTINIPNLTKPAYKISNKLFKVFIDSDGKSGYFSYGFKEKVSIKKSKGFQIFLNLKEFDFSSISFDSNESDQ